MLYFHLQIVKVWISLIWASIVNTTGTPYNTNVGVQKILDRAIWKPVVAKRNNTNLWSCPEPQILVTHSRQLHMAKQPASRDSLEYTSPLMHSSQTALQLFNLGQSIKIRIPHLLGHVGQLHTNVFHTSDSVSPCYNNKFLAWAIASCMRTLSQIWHRPFTVSFTLRLEELRAEPSGSERDHVTV